MIDLSARIRPFDLRPKIRRFWELSAAKIRAVERDFDVARGAPVFTIDGRYTTRGWTEWTQGFQFGSALLQFDGTGDDAFLDLGRRKTIEQMAPHVTHAGVHDHGFNNVSTFGTLLRLLEDGRFEAGEWERRYYEMALKSSGAIQALRWTATGPDDGYIYSFNGPHSLFADTMRTLRVLALAHQLGHVLAGENDERISLLGRAIRHARTTARYAVFYGDGRDGYDVRGRVAHESIFNVNDGTYRCAGTQQGYSPFSTWTRGLAWVLLGFTELAEFIEATEDELAEHGGRGTIKSLLLAAAAAAADFYIDHTPVCGVPYWDTGAPGLHLMGDYLDRPADPYNPHEPVDSSAAAIAAQGLLRLGRLLGNADGRQYEQAGLHVLDTLLSPPYLSDDERHHGLLLHAVYHWPNRWDHVPEGHEVACGESTMWGDYHVREAVLYVQRLIRGERYLTFFLGPYRN